MGSGSAMGVLVTVLEKEPVPMEFDAATRKSYAVLFVRPVTVVAVSMETPSGKVCHAPLGLTRYSMT